MRKVVTLCDNLDVDKLSEMLISCHKAVAHVQSVISEVELGDVFIVT